MTRNEALGRPLKKYSGKSISWIDLFLWVIPGILTSLALLFVGVYTRSFAYTQSGLSPAGWFTLAVLAFLPGGTLVIRRFNSARKAVLIHANGLSLINIRGDRMSLLWCQIHGIRTRGLRYHLFGLTVTDRLTLTLEPVHGDPIRITGTITGLAELTEKIKSAVYPILLPGLASDFDQGQTLTFGPLQFNREVLSAGRKTIHWHKVRELQVDSGKLVIRSADAGPTRIPISRIPNVDLILQLLEKHFTSG